MTNLWRRPPPLQGASHARGSVTVTLNPCAEPEIAQHLMSLHATSSWDSRRYFEFSSGGTKLAAIYSFTSRCRGFKYTQIEPLRSPMFWLYITGVTGPVSEQRPWIQLNSVSGSRTPQRGECLLSLDSLHFSSPSMLRLHTSAALNKSVKWNET